MERRKFLLAVGSGCSFASITGCLDSGSDATDNVLPDDGKSNSGNGQTGSTDGSGNNCHVEERLATEVVVDTSTQLEGGIEWTRQFRCEAGDLVNFAVSASNGQDVRVEIDSPRGPTVYNERGVSITTSQRFDTGGRGEVRIANLGERTREEREELWSDREDFSAGTYIAPWAEVREGDSIDYYIRQVSGARPILRIEDANGNVVREHAVAEVIDDEFTAPEDGRYYFYMENTANFRSGTWDYTFERVNQIPITTTAELTIEREYEENVEVCD